MTRVNFRYRGAVKGSMPTGPRKLDLRSHRLDLHPRAKALLPGAVGPAPKLKPKRRKKRITRVERGLQHLAMACEILRQARPR